jgi:NAD(P)-dependent dehydrogenase (short-subunit alcohol dehydrogenase family)
MPCGAINLRDKVAVVTGGGSGINLAFAKLAFEQGAKLIIADLKLTDEGQKFVETFSSDSVMFAKCDVRKRSELENLITVSREKFGTIPEVYIAGAGVFEPVGRYNPSSEFVTDGHSRGRAGGKIPKRTTMLNFRSTPCTHLNSLE